MSASSRTPSITFGDSFDLLCLVKPRHNPRVPTSVTWHFKPAGTEIDGEAEGEFKELVTFTREGTLQWGEQLLGLGTRTTVDRSHSHTNFWLSVTRAGRREAGKYRCTAVLWRRNYDNSWSRVANRTSNPLGISVLQPGKAARLCCQVDTHLIGVDTDQHTNGDKHRFKHTVTHRHTQTYTLSNRVKAPELRGFLPALIALSPWFSH